MPRGTEKVPIVPNPGGVLELANPADLPTGKFAVVTNWVSREDTLIPRPGYTLIDSQLAAADAVIGFGFRGSRFNEARMVTHTVSTAYSYNGSTFSDVTGTWTTSGADDPVRFVPFSQGGTVYLLRINSVNAIDEYTGTGNFTSTTASSGTVPSGKDIINVSGRVVVAAANGDPFRVQWSGFNDRTAWGDADFALLQDTSGSIIGSAPFNALSFGIYKEDSVILGTAVPSGIPFQFQVVGETSGPVSPAAIVPYEGIHYWFGGDGNIYRFDGGRIGRFASDLTTTITNNFDWTNRAKCHGMVLNLVEPQLWFWYPDATTGLLTRAISVNLRTEQQQNHEFTHSITASKGWVAQPGLTIDQLTGTIDDLDSQYGSIDAMGGSATQSALIGESTGHVDRFNTATQDRGTDFAWEIDYGWRPIGGFDHDFYFDGVASYWAKEATSNTVTVSLKVSNRINDAESETTDTFDMSDDAFQFNIFTDLRGKWARARFTGTAATSTMQFRGGAMLGWRRNMRGP